MGLQLVSQAFSLSHKKNMCEILLSYKQCCGKCYFVLYPAKVL